MTLFLKPKEIGEELWLLVKGGKYELKCPFILKGCPNMPHNTSPLKVY
jgi:hypothetical protein